MKAVEKIKLIKEGKLTAEENTKNFLDKIKKENDIDQVSRWRIQFIYEKF